MEIEKLKSIGLSKSESQIYLSLLKLDEANVTEISKDSGLHRTNIYDSLEKLKEKGLISYLTKNNKQFFRANNPENIIDYLKEKELEIKKIIPELKKIQSQNQKKINIEIFKGKNGIKNVLRNVLKQKKELVAYGASGQLREYLPKFAEYYLMEQEKHKIKHKFIYTDKAIGLPKKYYEIKYLPKEFEGPTMNLCYGDIIINLIWEPEMTAIKIESKQLAENFRKYFELLWKMAKK